MSANEELDQLKSLLEKGILTQEEFEAKKKLLEDQKGTEPESSSISENISDAVSSNDSPSTTDTNIQSVAQSSEVTQPDGQDESTLESFQVNEQSQKQPSATQETYNEAYKVNTEESKRIPLFKKTLVFFLKWIGIYLGIFLVTSLITLFSVASTGSETFYYSTIHSLGVTWAVDFLAFIPFVAALIVIEVRRRRKDKDLTDDDKNQETTKKSKKVTLKVVLILLILQILLIVITFAFPVHSWAEATCTTPKTCTICKMTEGVAEGHEWKNATCTEPKQCSRCGITFGTALGHDMEKMTCTESSVCKRCGIEISATGHKWKEATCTEPKTCSVCGATEGDALGHTTTNGTCSRCGQSIFETVTGSGDDVIEGLQLSTGMYRVHVTNSGSSNFAVWADGTSSSRDLKINDIGSYDGYIFLAGGDTYKLEIKSSGSWSYTVEQLQATTNTTFSGTGDYVTDKVSCSSGTWHFSHDGSSNFVVKAYTTNGRDLLVNTIGSYDGKKSVTVPQGSYVVFEINADGNWSAEKQ